ncbi:hypothetical protein INR49_027231 [Caranx melampygus]|nr:hypothetical protein INR49_027231 [Caranx melampygus]
MLKAPSKSDEQMGTKILLDAMSKDKVHLAKFVLDALDGEIVDSITEGAQTPLISSVLLPDGQARCKFVELLLQRGAGVNCQDASGRTALSYACEKGYLDAVKTLVRSNADPEIVDRWGNTALMYAAVAGQSPVVEFLVRAFKRLGLQIDRQNKVGNSAVEVAKFLGHTECIFALTNNSKRGRESEGNAQPRLSLRYGEASDKCEINVGHLVNKLEVLPTCNHADCLMVQNCPWQPRPWVKQSKLLSMDSIEEFEREDDGCSSPPQEIDFSGILTPKIPSDCSPKNTPAPGAPSALDILLTPILANKSDGEPGTEETKVLDFGVRRFHDSYYQKRCSLPTSVLSLTPPERTLMLSRISRTVRRREASPCKAEPLQVTAASAAGSHTTFSVLSNKLLRRFTSPEFKKDAKELDPVSTSGRIPRSETFPQSVKHPQVGSKPSVDSISSVKCEFDFHFRVPNS